MRTITPTLMLTLGFLSVQQCLSAQYAHNPSNVYAFTINGTGYEIVRENRNWADAAACAVFRGGKLAEINSQEEQDSLFYHMNNAGIAASGTVAPDGGGASYLWLGGNDLANEGNWVWNGDNDTAYEPFWIGNVNGSPVGTMYTNWGYEPDNWNQQDGLGLAFTNWPLGSNSPLGLAGQWNDVDLSNALYYIIEFPAVAAIGEQQAEIVFSVFPNPAENQLTVVMPGNATPESLTITTLSGEVLIRSTETVIDLSSLATGAYLLTVTSGHQHAGRLIIKQ